RWRASSSSRANITRPAAMATDSGANADSPAAIGSTLTYSRTPNAARSKNGAAVVLPAPLGPATTTIEGALYKVNSTRTSRDYVEDLRRSRSQVPYVARYLS